MDPKDGLHCPSSKEAERAPQYGGWGGQGLPGPAAPSSGALGTEPAALRSVLCNRTRRKPSPRVSLGPSPPGAAASQRGASGRGAGPAALGPGVLQGPPPSPGAVRRENRDHQAARGRGSRTTGHRPSDSLSERGDSRSCVMEAARVTV